jgi:plastocyanin
MYGYLGLRHSNWILAVLLLALSGCGIANTSTSGPTHSALPRTGAATVKIPAGDRFLPFVTEVAHGGIVSFHNGDADAHTVTSTPGDPSAFDVRVEAGATVTLTLTVRGSFRYYCSIHATYDPQTDQIAAKATADHPDEPMEGVLVVG